MFLLIMPMPDRSDPTTPAGWVSAYLWSISPALLLAALIARGYRKSRYRALRGKLEALTAGQREAVLLPLRTARGDTRRIAAQLSRDFGVRTELTPASAPTGRGAEVTAGEEGG